MPQVQIMGGRLVSPYLIFSTFSRFMLSKPFISRKAEMSMYEANHFLDTIVTHH